MRLLEWAKDGGKDSNVNGFYVIEIKPAFSIILLKFSEGSREAFHSHAFNALSWILKGSFVERLISGGQRKYKPSVKPKVTKRETFHKVFSKGTTWVLTLRGPWKKTWKEYSPASKTFVTLTNGRIIVDELHQTNSR